MGPEAECGHQSHPSIQIVRYHPRYAVACGALVRASFERFVASDISPEGQNHFFSIVARVLGDDHAAYTTFCALRNEEPVGIISMREACHLSLFFCEPGSMGRGLGRMMLSALERHLISAHPAGCELTVNSSLFAVNIYRRLGFEVCGEPTSNNGILFQSMVKSIQPPERACVNDNV
ncbi:GNAT family N-acetyltransferase [Teredinibacter turnerae]|uniref:GNAT family N-acetyltransferase n=1 Tax=Teredinibacter turnerae TaxID=2426 RepID=UPI000405831F|nr:GNAT family N-acetyltransferase [Teredinibacter turnerae]